MITKKKFCIVFILTSYFVWRGHSALNCTEKGAGRFTDPDDTTCKLYYLCVYVESTNSYQSYNYTCPENTYFDPTKEGCSNSYVCTTDQKNDAVTCTKAGRIADPSDTSCQKYFMCVTAANGTIVPYPYSCPPSTVFNPQSGLCTSSSYVCPT